MSTPGQLIEIPMRPPYRFMDLGMMLLEIFVNPLNPACLNGKDSWEKKLERGSLRWYRENENFSIAMERH